MVNSPNKKMTEAGFQHEINMQKKLLETQPNRKIKKIEQFLLLVEKTIYNSLTTLRFVQKKISS